MANAKHEDAVMKMGFDYFRNTILKTLGIDYQYEEIGPTELVELTIQIRKSTRLNSSHVKRSRMPSSA